MKAMKLTTLFAIMSLCAGLAVAQPAPDAATTSTEAAAGQHRAARDGKKGERHWRQRGEGRFAGPYARLKQAAGLEDLTEEQKAKITAFEAETKASAQALAGEMKQVMQDARETTDRAARRQAMEPIREKFQAENEKVDAFLKGALTEAQQKQLKEKARSAYGQAGNRMRNKWNKSAKDVDSTTGVEKSGKAGRKGKHRKNGMKKAGAKTGLDNSQTTGTANSPFAR